MDIGRPFIQLPYHFDAARLADELRAVDPGAWMQHPQRLQGNSALALISRDGGDNDAFSGAMAETPHLAACPYLRQVLASFDVVLGRSRLMRLAAGAEVALHVDFNYHWYSRVRIHVPIVTSEAVTFYCADERRHMRAGESWIFNAWRRHRVVNAGQQDRIHLVIDTAGSARFWSMLRAAAAGEMDSIEVPFEPARTVALRTEKYNAPTVMSPGELDALVADLIRDFSANPNNDSELVARYQSLLIEFSKDWRALWLEHGEEPAAQTQYRAAIDKVYAALAPDRRALVTQSNDIGVNPIIVQRILRAALADYDVA